MAERKETDGVKVKDRRVSAQEEQPRTPASDARAAEAAGAGSASAAKAEGEERERDATCDEPIPEVDFVTFVVSLSTNALVSLGLLPRPDTGEKQRDLPLARQTIDILTLLQQKTKGNLTGEEERILDTVLYDLRMTYVQVVRKNC
ncbi:MAG: DUF1844 domain-containing protein [Deltaproteobacteria bacterium]|nr:DUF1844 domain-containing protein [Deltaproteobacteria bacterium]